MARYDDETQRFMDDLSGKKQSKEDLARGAVGIASTIIHKKPVSHVAIREFTKQLLEEKEATVKPLSLFRWLNMYYGQAWWDWEPETIWMMLEHDHSMESPEALRELVMALQVIVKTDAPLDDWHVFEKVGHALNGDLVDFSAVHPLEPDAAAAATKVIQTIRPKEEFSSEVLAYMAACCHAAGITYMPPELFPTGCQGQLDKFVHDTALRDAAAKTWKSMKPDMSPLGVQAGKLQEIEAHCQEIAHVA